MWNSESPRRALERRAVIAVLDPGGEVRDQCWAVGARERALAAYLAYCLLDEDLRHRTDARRERLGARRQEGRGRRIGDADIGAADPRARARGVARPAESAPGELRARLIDQRDAAGAAGAAGRARDGSRLTGPLRRGLELGEQLGGSDAQCDAEERDVERRVGDHRSEERRVGKECRYRWSPYH